jgi:DNA-binding transcriptional LysR family regulator
MQRGSLDQLVAFVAVARQRSFTAAAAKLDVSQSALSHQFENSKNGSEFGS